MKSTRSARGANRRRDLRAEYRFDYTQSRANCFAPALGRETVAVALEPDVAKVFGTSRAVNQLLRSVIKAVPRQRTIGKRAHAHQAAADAAGRNWTLGS